MHQENPIKYVWTTHNLMGKAFSSSNQNDSVNNRKEKFCLDKTHKQPDVLFSDFDGEGIKIWINNKTGTSQPLSQECFV